MAEITSKDLVVEVCNALADKRGKDIIALYVREKTDLCDYFVIASATNISQLHALVDSVEEKLFKAGYECKQKEGNLTSTWMLMDYNDVIVHVFSQEDRLFYDLERIWRDGKVLESTDEL